MIIHSTRFGQIEVDETDVLKFPGGLPGFPEETVFAFFPYKPDSPFYFLHSATAPDLSFLIINPFDFFTDYEFSLDDEQVKQLQISQDVKPEVYCIVTLKGKIEEMTANLLAPIIVNRQIGVAMQVILEKSDYTTKHSLISNQEKKAAEGGK